MVLKKKKIFFKDLSKTFLFYSVLCFIYCSAQTDDETESTFLSEPTFLFEPTTEIYDLSLTSMISNIPTTQKCFLNVTNVISSDSQITFFFTTNFLNNFTCYSNESFLIIKNDMYGSQDKAVCHNLQPVTEYNFVFETECDFYVDNEPISTKYESLNCSLEKQEKSFNVECDHLRCRNCSVVFELYDKELNISEEIAVSAQDNITFEHRFSELNCSQFSLYAFILKKNFSPSGKIQIDQNIEIFPSFVDFDVGIDLVKMQIEFLVENRWKYCRKSQIKKIISAPVECNSTTFSQIFESLLNISSTDDLNETVANKLIRYSTNYSLEVIIEKEFDSSVKLINKTIFFETDGFPVDIDFAESDSNKIWFEFSDPLNCTHFDIYCKDENETLVTLYDKELKNGSCTNLVPNKLYQLVVETKNHSETIISSLSIFTKVVPVSLFYFDQTNELNFTFEINCTKNQFDSYQLMYRNSSTKEQFISRPLIMEGCTQLPFDAEFHYGTELLHGTSYEMKIRTFGCNRTCEADSDSFFFKTRLDNFQLESSPLSTLSCTNSSIMIKLTKMDLPRDQYGTIYMSCSNKVSYKKKCQMDNDALMCNCDKLELPNCEYKLYLFNEKDDFVTVENFLGTYFTRPNPVIFKQITFTGLFGLVNFESINPSPLTHQLCYKLATMDICSPLVNSTFNGTDKNEFKFGNVYTFYILTTGYLNFTEKSNEKEVTVGLDRVKIPQNHPTFTSERVIRLSFKETQLPEQNWDYISIKCQNSQTKVISQCIQIGGNINCTCDTLIESTMYAVSILSNKEGFMPGEASAGLAYTKPPLVSCKPGTEEKIFEIDIECLLDESKSEYLSDLLLYLTNEETKQVVNVTCSIGSFQNCNLLRQRLYSIFQYNFRDLNPGTNYTFESQSYSSRIPISQFNSAKIKLQTEIDEPKIISISLKSNKLELRFQPPRTTNYELDFLLYELKDKNLDICSVLSYKKNTKFYSDSVTFDYELSTTFKVEYTVGFKMRKIGFKTKENVFQQSYRVPFPTYAIVLLSLAGIILFTAPPGMVFLIKYQRQRRIRQRTLIKPSDLKKILDDWNQHQNAGLESEWLRLNNESAATELTENYELYGDDSLNREKNRYKDILPYKHSRVELLTVQNDDLSDDHHSSSYSTKSYYFSDDYINANFIPGLESQYQYIACQAPLKNTFLDFWKMVYERYISLIIMLANKSESGNSQFPKKCDIYWPQKLNERRTYGAITVRLAKIIEHHDYDIRYLVIEADEIHKVRLYNFKSWPDKKCPSKEALYNFLKVIRNQRTKSDNKGPVVVHCSAGIGRTGTYLAIEYLAELIRNKKSVDIYQRVLEMRRYRPKMVQNSIQYKFIYEMLAYINERQIQKRSLKRTMNDGLDDINNIELNVR